MDDPAVKHSVEICDTGIVADFFQFRGRKLTQAQTNLGVVRPSQHVIELALIDRPKTELRIQGDRG